MGQDLRWGAGWGLLGGLVYLVFAAAVLLLRGGGEDAPVSIPLLLAAYPVAGVVAGVVVGLFRPALRTRGGAMRVGAAAALPVCIGFVGLMRGPVSSWTGAEWFGAIGGAVLLGVMGGSILWGQLYGFDPDAYLRDAMEAQEQRRRRGRR